MWLGYISSVFYLSSRMSQIYKNFMRKCTEGLSVAMFLMAISANVSGSSCDLDISATALCVQLNMVKFRTYLYGCRECIEH